MPSRLHGSLCIALSMLLLALMLMPTAVVTAQGAQMAIVSIWLSPKYVGSPMVFVIPFNATTEPGYSDTYVTYGSSNMPAYSHLFSSSPPVVLVFEYSTSQQPSYTVYWGSTNPYTDYTVSPSSGVFGAYDDFDYLTPLWIINGSYRYSGSLLHLYPGTVVMTNASFTPDDTFALFRVQIASVEHAIGIDIEFLKNYTGYLLIITKTSLLANMPSSLYIYPVVDGEIANHSVLYYDPNSGYLAMLAWISGVAGQKKTIYIVYGRPLTDPTKRFNAIALQQIFARWIGLETTMYRVPVNSSIKWIEVRSVNVTLEPGDAIAPHLYAWFLNGVGAHVTFDVSSIYSSLPSNTLVARLGAQFYPSNERAFQFVAWYGNGYWSGTFSWALEAYGGVTYRVSNGVTECGYWYHFAGIDWGSLHSYTIYFNNGELELFMDGVSVASKSCSFSEVKWGNTVLDIGATAALGRPRIEAYIHYLIYSPSDVSIANSTELKNVRILIDPTFFNGTAYIDPISKLIGLPHGNVLRVPSNETWIWTIHGYSNDDNLHLLFFPYGSIVKFVNSSGNVIAWIRVVGPMNGAGMVEHLAIPASLLPSLDNVTIVVETWVANVSNPIILLVQKQLETGLRAVAWGGGVAWIDYASTTLSTAIVFPMNPWSNYTYVAPSISTPMDPRKTMMILDTLSNTRTSLFLPINITITATNVTITPNTTIVPHLFRFASSSGVKIGDILSTISGVLSNGTVISLKAALHVYGNGTGIYSIYVPSLGAEVPITISENSGNTLTNYSVKIVLNSTNFDGWNAVSDNGSDIYFTDANGNPLYYWIEYFNKTEQKAVIWVKVPQIPASGSVTIYMHYGASNPYASYNNVTKVFVKVYTFNSGGSITVLGSTYDFGNGFVYHAYRTSGGVYGAEYSTDAYEGAYSIHGWIGDTASNAYYLGFTADIVFPETGSGYSVIFHVKTAASGETTNNFVKVQRYDNSSSSWIDYESLPINSDWMEVEVPLPPPYTQVRVYFQAYTSSTSTSSRQDVWIDLVLIRKYVNPEPSINIGASEQQNVTVTILGKSYTFPCDGAEHDVKIALPEWPSFIAVSKDAWSDSRVVDVGDMYNLVDPSTFNGSKYYGIIQTEYVSLEITRLLDAHRWLWIVRNATGDNLVHLRFFPSGTIITFINATSGEVVKTVVLATPTADIVEDYPISLPSGVYNITVIIYPGRYHVIKLENVYLARNYAIAPHLYDWYFNGSGYVEVSYSYVSYVLGSYPKMYTLVTAFRPLGYSHSYGFVFGQVGHHEGIVFYGSSPSYYVAMQFWDTAGNAHVLSVSVDDSIDELLFVRARLYSPGNGTTVVDILVNGSSNSATYSVDDELRTLPVTVGGYPPYWLLKGYVSFAVMFKGNVSVNPASVILPQKPALFLDPTFFNGTYYFDGVNTSILAVPHGGVYRVPARKTWLWIVKDAYSDGYLHLRFFPYGSVIVFRDSSGYVQRVYQVVCTPDAVGLCEDVRVDVPAMTYSEVVAMIPVLDIDSDAKSLSVSSARSGNGFELSISSVLSPIPVIYVSAYDLTFSHAFDVWRRYDWSAWNGVAVATRFDFEEGESVAIAILNISEAEIYGYRIEAVIYTNSSWIFLFYAPDNAIVNTSILLNATGWYLLIVAFEYPNRIRIVLYNGSYLPNEIWVDKLGEFVYNATQYGSFRAVYGVGCIYLPTSGETGVTSVLYDWAEVIPWPVTVVTNPEFVTTKPYKVIHVALSAIGYSTILLNASNGDMIFGVGLDNESTIISIGRYDITPFGLVPIDASNTVYSAVGNASLVSEAWSVGTNAVFNVSRGFVSLFIVLPSESTKFYVYNVTASMPGYGLVSTVSQYPTLLLGGSLASNVEVATISYGLAYINITSSEVQLCGNVSGVGCVSLGRTTSAFVIGIGAYYDESTNTTTYYAMYIDRYSSWVAKSITIPGNVSAEPIVIRVINASVMLDRFAVVYGVFVRLLAEGEARMVVRGPFPLQTLVKMIYLNQPTIIELANGTVEIVPGGARGITLVGFKGFTLSVAVGAVTASNIPITSDRYTIDVPLGYTAMLVVDPVNKIVTIMSASPVQAPYRVTMPSPRVVVPNIVPPPLHIGFSPSLSPLLWYGLFAALAIASFVLVGDLGIGIALAGAVAAIVGFATGNTVLGAMGITATVVGTVISLALRRVR